MCNDGYEDKNDVLVDFFLINQFLVHLIKSCSSLRLHHPIMLRWKLDLYDYCDTLIILEKQSLGCHKHLIVMPLMTRKMCLCFLLVLSNLLIAL